MENDAFGLGEADRAAGVVEGEQGDEARCISQAAASSMPAARIIRG
jgi:hypothetical protein